MSDWKDKGIGQLKMLAWSRAWLHCFLVSWVPPMHHCTDLLHSSDFSACCWKTYLASLWSLSNQQLTLGFFPKGSLPVALKDSKEIQILSFFFFSLPFILFPCVLRFFMAGKVRDKLIMCKYCVTVMFSKIMIICTSLSSSLYNLRKRGRKEKKILSLFYSPQ